MTQQEFIERYHYDATRDLLGKGGFGRVYRAYDRIEHEYVAIKLQVVDPEHPELRLSKEVEKVQQYVHRYIARYKGCYTIPSLGGEMDIAVMKYYKDGSLDALIKSKKLDLEARFVMLRQILEGIAFLHSHGIIHRDLKPQNILIAEYDGTYEPLITDFGISKQLADGESSAVSNSILGGTYSYASPEQLKETTIRKNTDLWSFGIIAYQMLTGALPFNCGTFSPTSQEGRQEQFRQMTSGVLPEALSNIPEPWQTLIRECLVVDNTQRLAHVEDALSLIDNRDYKHSTIVEEVTVRADIEETIVEVPPMPRVEQKRYNIGDYYNENGLEGVVFDVWDDGRHGKIVSLDETQTAWDSRVGVTNNGFGKSNFTNGIRTYADNESDGKANTNKIIARSDSKYFCAFEWCRAKGRSWYLPAKKELVQINDNKALLYSTLGNYNGIILKEDLLCAYWSSTEFSESCACYVYLYDGLTGDNIKSGNRYVRAVATF